MITRGLEIQIGKDIMLSYLVPEMAFHLDLRECVTHVMIN